MGVNVDVGVEVHACLDAAFPAPVPAAADAAPSTIPFVFITSKSYPQLLEMNKDGIVDGAAVSSSRSRNSSSHRQE